MSSVATKTVWRAWSSFRIALILMLSSIVGMAGVLAIVSRGIDAHQARKEETLVQLRLTRSLESIGENLTTASVWDEAVERMVQGDVAWYDRTLGSFYAAQHRHQFTLAYDGSGRLFRVSTQDDRPSRPRPIPSPARPRR